MQGDLAFISPFNAGTFPRNHLRLANKRRLRSYPLNARRYVPLSSRRPDTRALPLKPFPNNNTDAQPAQSASSFAATKRQRSLNVRVFGRHISIPGTFVLLAVPFCWSTYSICLKCLYRSPWAFHPALFNFARLLGGALYFLPRLIRDWRQSVKMNRNDTAIVYRAGAELGLYGFLANTIQMFALRYTSASRGSFISQLATIIVPIAAFATGLEPTLGINVCIASFAAVAGVALLTLDDVAVPFTYRGDGAMFITAFIAAAYVIRSKIHSGNVRANPLIGVKVVAQAVYASIFLTWVALRSQTLNMQAISAVFVGATPALIALNIALIVWTSLSISVLSSELQFRGQALVSASEAIIIFTTGPMWVSLLAIPLGERFGLRGIIGAALILLSTLLASGLTGAKKEK